MEQTIAAKNSLCPECGLCDKIYYSSCDSCPKCCYKKECKKLFENSELKPYQNQEIKKNIWI